MRSLMHILIALGLWLWLAVTAMAQEDDKGFLTRTIQDALSGAGRTVSIDGFKGALSSSASFDRMTIADGDGVWLTLTDVVLDWNRSALLRGRLEVEKLTASTLDIPRLPIAEETPPDAEAAPFALPDLPVSIEIGLLSVDQIVLGAPLMGEAATLSLTAQAQYTEDVFDASIEAARLDGKTGIFTISANLARSDDVLDLALDLMEGPEGIAARLLNLPGQPSVEMSVQGAGPLDDFTSEIRVATDGQERLAGEITLGAQTPQRASATPDRRIRADIGGDITALLAPRFREFFGTDVRLKADALLEGNGAISLDDFTLEADAAEVSGQVRLNAEKWPTFIAIDGLIANADGTRVQLPLSGDAKTVEQVKLTVSYDAAEGDALSASFDIAELSSGGFSVAETSLSLDGTLQGSVGSIGQFQGETQFDAQGLAFTDDPLGAAVGRALRGTAQVTYLEGTPFEIKDLSLAGEDYALRGGAVIENLETGFSTVLDAVLEAQDISRFSALAGRDLGGQTRLALKGRVTPLSGQFDIAATGSTQDLTVGIEQADAVLAGKTDLSLMARRDETGTFLRDLVLENAAIELAGDAQLRTGDSRVKASAKLADVSLVLPQYEGPITVEATARQDARGWFVDAVTDGPYGAALSAKGLATGPDAKLDFTADVPESGRFVADLNGPVNAKGNLRQTKDGWRIETDASGPYGAQANVQGLVAPQVDVVFDATIANLQPLVPQLNGPVQVSGSLRQSDQGFLVDTTASGPYGLKAQIAGLATGPDMRLSFETSIPNVRPFAPGITGALQANGEVRQTPDGIAVRTTALGPYATRAVVEGVVTGPQAAVTFDLSMPNIGAVVDNINGPLDLTGRAQKQGTAWRITSSANGPSGTQAQLDGTANADGTLNLDMTGNAPLGLSRPFIAPRNLQGQAQFALAINGPAALSSVSGTIETSGATLSAPNLRVALEAIDTKITLARSRANIDLSARAVNGGDLKVAGAITLSPSLPADLQIGLRGLVLIDPRLYRTSVNGALRVAGPITGGAQISGQIDVGETVVNVPSTGLTSIGDIPPITHVGEAGAVRRTRLKAGVVSDAQGANADAAQGPGFGLGVTVNAPRQIFVRGRGLDAELGGGLRLTGTTNRIISAGRFELLRGRLDILGKRFDLVEGSIQFQGDLIPYLRFVSTTSTNTGDVSVIVQGPADAPEVSFTSSPAAPQDEVLAQLLFGRNLADISAFQALQLANAVATLAGRGGVGIISNLRDGFGLDDLDVTTTDSGATALRLGKYLSENVYTDVTAASDGTGEVSLNIDLTPNLIGKATLGSDGNSGIGLFFEKDY